MQDEVPPIRYELNILRYYYITIGGVPLILPHTILEHKCRNKSNTYLHAAELKTMPHPYCTIHTEGLNPS